MSRYQGGIITKSPATPTGPTTTGRAPGIWRMDDVAYWTKQGVWPNANIQAPDASFPYVSLLLSTTALGNANNNLFVDSSGAFNPISRNGNTTQGSATPYGASWSNYFDGTGDYLTVPYTTALQFPGDFTVETWVYPTARLQLYPCIFSNYNFYGVNGGLSIFAGHNSANTAKYQVAFNGSFPVIESTSNIIYNSWSHIALVRSGSTITLYVNGVANGTATSSATVTGTANNWWIGTSGDVVSQAAFNGYISNLRAVKGTAVYTSAFTPPTTSLTAISGTSLLTCQSNRFIDNSSNAFAITRNGDTSVTEFSPFSPAYPGISYNQSDITNWSGYFDGDGDYLSIPNSAAFSYGTGDFTMEAWVYKTATSGDRAVVDSYTAGSGGGTFGFLVNDTQINAYQTNVATYTFTYTVPINSWNHIAFVRTGGNLICYVNGTSIGSQANSANFISSSAINIGRNAGSGGSQWIGYISNLRIVKGTAVYTGNFTPSTTNLTAISGTSLLTLQNAAFTDNSTNNFIITQFGNTTVTGNSPFNTVGYWSNYFDGTGDYLNTAASSSLGLTGDWTVEGWVYQTSTAGAQIFLDTRGSGATGFGIYCSLTGYAGGPGAIGYANNAALVATSSTAIPLNTWTHLAFTRSGNTVTGYINGVSAFTYTESRTLSSTMSYFIGADYLTGSNAYGYFSNFRVVRGTAVYTSAFTPPTSPLTAITNTSLLTCQNGRFIDNSTNAFAITVNGNTSVQSFDPFYTSTIASNGGSMYFDGTGDYLRGANSPAFAFGTGNFTVEMWAYFMDPTATNRPLFDNGATSNTGRLLIRQGNDAGTANVVNAFVSGTTVSSPTIQFYSWTHVAVVRNSGTVTIYINGVGGTGVSATADLTQNACLLGAFYDVLTNNFTGYMSNVRVTKGTAVYTANFTPPTSVLTPSASTTLLVNGMNAGAYDATAINNMETVGNAQVSTAQSKFGGSSMYFDGSGDYLVPANRDAGVFGTGAFTVECWVYATGAPQSNQVIWSCNLYPNTTGLYLAYFGSGSTQLSVAGGGSLILTASSGWSLNEWHHVAVVRSGSTLTLYIDGTSRGSTTFTNNCTDGLTFIGRPSDVANYMMQGYIDDLRITKGVARYTANFTPPTQAFPPY